MRMLKLTFVMGILAVMSLAFSVAGPAFADENQTQTEQAEVTSGDITPAALSVSSAKNVAEVFISGDTAGFTKGRSFKTLTSRTISIPATAKSSLLTVDFTASSFCFGADQGYCNVKILVDGVLAKPQVGFVQFDSTNFALPSALELDGHSVKGYSTCLAPGEHIVEVQIASQGKELSDEDPSFSLSEWTMEIQRSNGCR